MKEALDFHTPQSQRAKVQSPQLLPCLQVSPCRATGPCALCRAKGQQLTTFGVGLPHPTAQPAAHTAAARGAICTECIPQH